MEHLRILRHILFALALPALARAQSARSWDQRYTAEEAKDPNIIALWQFLPGQETEDLSGNGHTLTLCGSGQFRADGKFESCLESFPADTANDNAQGAEAKSMPTLTPKGAFTLEAWMKFKPEADTVKTAFLIDKKYFNYAKDFPRANWDYGFYMSRRENGEWVLTTTLGFGTDSVWSSSKPVTIPVGEWHHVAFTYDGEGTCRFFLDGDAVGRARHEGRGPITPGTHRLAIGDRVGSTHAGFPGYLDQVCIRNDIPAAFAGSLEASVSAGRTAFFRMEENAAITIRTLNDTGRPLSGITADILFAGKAIKRELGALEKRGETLISIPFDTSLKPGKYPISVIVKANDSGRRLSSTVETDIHLLARPLPDQMPVVMWGGGDAERLNYVGFTHRLDHLVDYARVWEAGEPTQALADGAVESKYEMLNEQLINGLRSCVYVYPGRWVEKNKDLDNVLRVDRTGTPYSQHNTSASHPDVRKFAYNVGASIAQTYGTYPALSASLVHSEIRDGTAISFHDFEKEAARKALGFGIPPSAVGKNGVSYKSMADFPADRVIPDDHPLLQFYTWFWKDGDGWNPLHTDVHRGLKSTGRDDLWTFFDPAVRVPSVWGSGGGVDVISQWTYSYPDPIKIGQATDELFAMADGQPGQQVMKMTQVIWYRSGTAPELPKEKDQYAPWENEIPDAKFITISPDHMREAFWSKMSRPIRGIMYHGWGSLYPAQHGSYRHTNPITREVLQELVMTVVRPLGPTLLQVPDMPTDVAVLESFSSQIFASRGSFGWSGSWEADMHLICQWAGLQPRILYDEHVRQDALKDINVLFMPFCDVLTETVAGKIREFQERGGIVIGDEQLCPAINPDIVIESCKRPKEAREGKEALLEKATGLREELDPFYTPYASSSQAEIVPRVRRYGNTDYLFAINDLRTYGNYVGHHKRVMEKGLPNEGTLSLNRRKGYVYDLVKHQAVSADTAKGHLTIPASFGPGDGKLFMVTKREIARIACAVPARAIRGKTFDVKISVMASFGRQLDAVIPVQLVITDAVGMTAERTGYYAAVDGKLKVTCHVAANDEPGEWTIEATELASGKTCQDMIQID